MKCEYAPFNRVINDKFVHRLIINETKITTQRAPMFRFDILKNRFFKTNRKDPEDFLTEEEAKAEKLICFSYYQRMKSPYFVFKTIIRFFTPLEKFKFLEDIVWVEYSGNEIMKSKPEAQEKKISQVFDII